MRERERRRGGGGRTTERMARQKTYAYK